MAKNIVLLSDGTGNSAAKLFKTNVWRLYQALDLQDPHQQIAYYDDGVGTSAFRPLALIGSALGYGLKHNVKDLYGFLCRNYAPGDAIYAFGFSRGAFTIRTLVGMIASQGIIRGRTMHPDKLRREIDLAYKADRASYRTNWTRLGKRAEESATEVDPSVPAEREPAKIQFLGLWDTVDAYGLPIDELKRGLDHWALGLSFPDQDLSPIVERACHALALDDERRTFHPVLWNEAFEQKLLKRKKIQAERLKQVWFAGMHSNVGGGYAKDGLAYITLNWMLQEAGDGLKTHANIVAEYKQLENPNDEIGDSRSGLAAYYRYDPRRVSNLCDDAYNKVKIERAKIHHSVFDRIKGQQIGYVPHPVPRDYDVVQSNGTVTSGNYETAPQAENRYNDLERTWDLVWWRRVVYFLILAATAMLVLFPWMFPVSPKDVCTGPFCLLEPVIIAGGKFLPGFADTWLNVFRVHIGKFLLFGGALVVALGCGSWLKSRIIARATESWCHLTGVTAVAQPAWGPISKFARALRQSDRLVGGYRWVARQLLPFLAFVALVLAVLFGTNRLLFEVAESAGRTCTRSSGALKSVAQEPVAGPLFETKNPCYASGIQLEKDANYIVTFTVIDPWIDGRKHTTPRGFKTSEGSLRHFFAVPLRRSWGLNWFEPLARISRHGRERIRLAAKPKSDDSPIYVSDEFTARISGEMFLFVNDAVIAAPWLWSYFYSHNNKGNAQITVRRVEPSAR